MSRTISFGYMIPRTEIEVMNEEAVLVENSFNDYIKGMSLTQIAGKLNQQPIKYDEDRGEWDSHMVLYMLRNERYKGDDKYPQIVDTKVFDRVGKLIYQRGHRMSEDEKPFAKVYKEKIVCAACGCHVRRQSHLKGRKDMVRMVCSNPDCDCKEYFVKQIKMESMLKAIFTAMENGEITIECEMQGPDKLDKNEDIIKKTNELRLNMQNPIIDADEIISRIREVAMIRFSACENSDTTSQTEYIKEIIKGCHKQERIDADIIEKTVERITMTQDKMMIVRLINGKEISERMT